MVDLPMLLYKKTQQISEERMALLNISLAPNMSESSFKSLVERLAWSLGEEESIQDEFDAEGVSSLRQRLERR